MTPDDPSYETERKRIIKGRNRVLGLVLLGMVALFYLITFAKFGGQ